MGAPLKVEANMYQVRFNKSTTVQLVYCTTSGRVRG
jgi:hypothetical protein